MPEVVLQVEGRAVVIAAHQALHDTYDDPHLVDVSRWIQPDLLDADGLLRFEG